MLRCEDSPIDEPSKITKRFEVVLPLAPNRLVGPRQHQHYVHHNRGQSKAGSDHPFFHVGTVVCCPVDEEVDPVANAQPLQNSQDANWVAYLVRLGKSKSEIMLSSSPIAKRAKTLITFFALTGLLLLTARGMATPIMKRKEGKTRSAKVSPFHLGWISHQQAPSISRVWSARIIPKTVNPL